MNALSVSGNSSIKDYTQRIVSQEVDKNYIMEELKRKTLDMNQISDTMACLRNCLPVKYFHEVLYCSVVYTSIFEKIFPNMARRVCELAAIEWMQYVNHKNFVKGPINTSYRDHLVHMFKTIYTGTRLLESTGILRMIARKQFTSPHFEEWRREQRLSSNWGTEDREDIIRIAFFLSGLFHDFGYGHYYLCQYKKQLFELYKWMPCETANLSVANNKAILKSLPSFMIRKFYPECKNANNEKIDLIVMGFLRDCLQLNHSIASTLFIVNLAESLREARALTEKLYVAFHIAAEAAMIHDLMRQNKWLYLKRKRRDYNHFLSYRDHRYIPVGILLALVDELSVWRRPKIKLVSRINKKRIKTNEIRFIFEDPIPGIKLNISTRRKAIIITDSKDEVKNSISRLAPFKKGEGFVFLDYQLEFN